MPRSTWDHLYDNVEFNQPIKGLQVDYDCTLLLET